MQSSGVTVSHGHTSCSLEQRWQQHRAHSHHHFSFLCSFHTIYKQLKLQRIVTWDQHWPQWKENEERLKMQEINYTSNNTLESISIFLLTSLPPLARTSANFEPELKAQSSILLRKSLMGTNWSERNSSMKQKKPFALCIIHILW